MDIMANEALRLYSKYTKGNRYTHEGPVQYKINLVYLLHHYPYIIIYLIPFDQEELWTPRVILVRNNVQMVSRDYSKKEILVSTMHKRSKR